MFNVAFRTKVGTHKGVVTWTSFQDEAEFNKWYNEKMKSWYEVVERGVSEERAKALCTTAENLFRGFKAEFAEMRGRRL